MNFFEEALKLFGGPPEEEDSEEPSPKPQMEDALAELKRLTTDDSDEDVQQRSLAIYLAIVRHVRSGGTVKFITGQGGIRTLKVRLR